MFEMVIARTTNNSLIQKNYDLSVILKVKTEEISSGSEREEEEKSSFDSLIGTRRISDEISFLICQSCFWCASYICNVTAFTARKGYTPPTKCPICIEGNIESMLINKNEAYKFDYDTKRGVVLEFLLQ
jgi:hypothetical protein